MSRIIRPSVETALAQVRRLYHPDSAEGVLVDAVERGQRIEFALRQLPQVTGYSMPSDEVDRLMRTVFDAVREGMS
jgi:hypothetical protein